MSSSGPESGDWIVMIRMLLISGIRRSTGHLTSSLYGQAWSSLFVATFLLLCNPSLAYPPPPLYYHHYDNMTAELRHIQQTYPQLTSLYSIGTSAQGRDLWVLEITADSEGIGLPYVKLVGNIHGNEPLGKELVIHLAKYLLAQYNEGEPEAVNILKNTKLHLMPSMNPDGFELASEGTCRLGPGRGNANGVDLNRNFPEDDSPRKRKEEPETRAVREWLATRPFLLSASLHGGALLANYPFDKYRHQAGRRFTRELGEAAETDDDDVFRHLALIYSESHPDMHKGISCKPPFHHTFNRGITNGAAWYPVSGGMQDYNYLSHGCMELTLEIGCCKFPPVEQLPSAWTDNLKPLLKFISESQRGVKGLVIDELTQEGIKGARIKVSGRNMTFYTSDKGEFWRILLPGSYFLEVTAQGYRSSHVRISVPKSQYNVKPSSVWMNITLRPLGEDNDMLELTSEGVDTLTEYEVATSDPSSHILLDYYRSNETFPTDMSTSLSKRQLGSISVLLMAIQLHNFL